MKALALTNKGIEDIASDEIKDILGCTTTPAERVVLFNANSREELYTLAYKAQTISRVLLLLCSFSSENIQETLQKELEKITLDKEKNYRITGERHGTHTFSSPDITRQLAQHFSKTNTIDLKKGKEQLYFVIINNRFHLGMDVAGFDLSKRDYRIFTNAYTIKAPLAAALVRMSGFSDGSTLLDPFCRDGTIALEAAHHATKISPHVHQKQKFNFHNAYDSSPLDSTTRETTATIIASDKNFENLSAAKKNAKLANQHKTIEFRKYAIEDLDIRVEEKSINIVIALLHPSQQKNEKKLQQFYDAVQVVLKTKGTLLLAGKRTLETPEGFIEKEKREIQVGKETLNVLRLKKQ